MYIRVWCLQLRYLIQIATTQRPRVIRDIRIKSIREDFVLHVYWPHLKIQFKTILPSLINTYYMEGWGISRIWVKWETLVMSDFYKFKTFIGSFLKKKIWNFPNCIKILKFAIKEKKIMLPFLFWLLSKTYPTSNKAMLSLNGHSRKII